MKKLFIVIILFINSQVAHSDVYYLPVQYSGFFGSAELVSMWERVKSSYNTLGFWTGLGCLDPLFDNNHPVGTIQLTLEGRQYFKPDLFRHFFISGYLGVVYVTDFKEVSNFGLIPGLKISYQSKVSNRMILEPYMSLSLPLICDKEDLHFTFPFPALTIGVRFGISNIANKIKS